MASNSNRVYHTGFTGIDNSRAAHLTPEGSFKNLVNIYPRDGILEQDKKLAKSYNVLQIRENTPSQLKIIEPVYDQTNDVFDYLCVTETQAWLQKAAALEQISGISAKNFIKAFDFSVDADGLTGTRTTLVGNQDGVEDYWASWLLRETGESQAITWAELETGQPNATTWSDLEQSVNPILDDCLLVYPSSDNNTHIITFQTDYVNTNVALKGKYLIKPDNTNVDGFKVGSTINNVTGLWSEFNLIGVTDTNGVFTLTLTSNSMEVFIGSGVSTDDLIWFKELIIYRADSIVDEPDSLVEQQEIPIILKSVNLTESVESPVSQCFLGGLNYDDSLTDLPAIDDYIQIEITSGTEFKIFKNINGTPTDIAVNQTIDNSVPITGTNYIVYFTKETSDSVYDNYNIGDYWRYTRSELPKDTTYDNSPFSISSYAYDVYFTVSDKSVLRYRDGVITSVGYADAVKGRHVHLFTNKLFVSQYGGTINDRYRLRWSALNDPDLFYKALVSEAGEKDFLYTFKGQQPFQGITGIQSYQNLLYVYFPSAVHFGQHLGITQGTMYFEQFRSDVGSLFPLGPITARNGQYFIGDDFNFYLSTGQQITPIGEKIKDEFRKDIVDRTDENFPKVWGWFNEKTEEICWCYARRNLENNLQFRVICYNETIDAWHFRNLPSNLTDTEATEITTNAKLLQNTSRLIWGAVNYFYRDYLQTDTREVDLLADDITASSSSDFIIPEGVNYIVGLGEDLYIPEISTAATIVVETKDYSYDNTYIQDLDTFFLDAYWLVAKNVEVYISTRELLTEPITWVSLGLWTPELKNKLISHKIKHGKIFRYKFVVNSPDDTNLIDGFKLAAWSDNIYTNEIEQ